MKRKLTEIIINTPGMNAEDKHEIIVELSVDEPVHAEFRPRYVIDVYIEGEKAYETTRYVDQAGTE